MPPERRRAGDPREWLRRARGDLALAQVARGREGVLLEDLCFHARQAVEKGIKALLVARAVPFPKTHAITELLTLAEDAGVHWQMTSVRRRGSRASPRRLDTPVPQRT